MRVLPVFAVLTVSFAFFLVIMPALGFIETPRKLPNSITEAVLDKNKTGGAGQLAHATASPEIKG